MLRGDKVLVSIPASDALSFNKLNTDLGFDGDLSDFGDFGDFGGNLGGEPDGGFDGGGGFDGDFDGESDGDFDGESDGGFNGIFGTFNDNFKVSSRKDMFIFFLFLIKYLTNISGYSFRYIPLRGEPPSGCINKASLVESNISFKSIFCINL